MNALHISLRCLGHPASLAAIGLLLVNDHFLKAASPSWLTGKLSDFAGLFFFPYLAALVLSLLSDVVRVPSRVTGRIAFAATAAWFVLVKTSPWANALTEDALSGLLGAPARIVPDATDLIALTGLWPAWRLWAAAERIVPSGWVRWAGLGLAAFATMATSCLPIQSVDRVFVVDGELYAGMSYWHGGDRSVARSAGDGQDWSAFVDPPPEFLETANQPVSLPLTVCDPSEPLVCYRIAGRPEVERSIDGGDTWNIDWQLPLGRRYYMNRFPGGLFRLCAKTVDVGPYDMAFVGQGGAGRLVVASGNEGILVRSPNGEWQRQAVMSAIPTPFFAASFGEAASVLTPESILAVLVGLITLLALSMRSWSHLLLPLGDSPDAHRSRRWARRPSQFMIGFLAGLVVLAALTFMGFGSIVSGLLQILPFECLAGLVVFTPPIAFLMTWNRVAGLSRTPSAAWKTAGWCGLTAVAASAGALTPLYLWASGVIAAYEVASILGIALAVAVMYVGNRRVQRARRAAVVESDERDSGPTPSAMG